MRVMSNTNAITAVTRARLIVIEVILPKKANGATR